MFQIYTLIPLIVFLFTSYLFNKPKLKKGKSFIWMVSIFEAIISYLIVYLIFFTGFISGMYQFFLLILALFGFSYTLFLIEKDLDKDIDLQIETIKNNLVLFVLTFVPFYLFLTIFRFQGTLLQTTYSLLIVLVLVFLYFLLRTKINQFVQFIQDHLFDTTERTIGFLGGGFLFLVLFIFLFNLPIESIKLNLNLMDNQPYLANEDLPIDLENNFKRDIVFEIRFQDEFTEEILDYYYFDNTLFLYTNNSIYSIDPTSGEILYSKDGFLRDFSTNPSFSQLMFFEQEQTLYFINRNEVYEITDHAYDLIDQAMVETSKVFVNNNAMHLIHKVDATTYDIRKLENNAFDFVESIDLSLSEDYTGVEVLGQTLFYRSATEYIEFYNQDNIFPILGENPAYDSLNGIMYSTTYDLSKLATIYYQSKGLNDVQEYERRGMQNSLVYVHQGFVYFHTSFDEEVDHLDIMNKDFEFQVVHSYFDYKPFWIGHAYTSTRIVDFQSIDDGIAYLQIDQNDQMIQLSYHTIIEEETGLDAPFYAHYGLWLGLPTLVGFLIPLSNYRRSITIIGFDEATKKRN